MAVAKPSMYSVAVAVLLMVVAGVIGALVDGGITKFIDSVTSDPVADIRSPSGPIVPHEVELSGTYSDVSPEQDIWAVTQALDSNRFYPQDRACIALQGRFNCGDFYIGPAQGGAGQTYHILILSATDEAANEFYRYQLEKEEDDNPGLSSLPGGVEVIFDKEVVRS